MKILIMINDAGGLYKFRKELVIELISRGNEVVVAAPDGEYKQDIINLGAEYVDVDINRRGKNIIEEFRLLHNYIKILRRLNPDKAITYTIKPNIYGGIACRFCKVPYISTIVGLGSVYIGNQRIKPLIMRLTKEALKNSSAVFFLNNDNMDFYIKNKLINGSSKVKVVRGSGVDTSCFSYSKQENKPDNFMFIGRLLRDKGIYEFVEAARIIKKKYPEVIISVIGPSENDNSLEVVQNAANDGVLEYYGKQRDIIPYMRQSTCIVLPSYGEGCGTVLQEGASIGRPLITCDTYGCRDNVISDYNGFFCNVSDVETLVNAMEKVIALSYEEKVIMGQNSRKMAEDYFERSHIIDCFMREIIEKEENE